MITRKLLLCGILGAATLCSTLAFASYHSHHYHPRIKIFDHRHHPREWRNVHRWAPHRNYVEVQNGTPYSRYHHHY